MCQVSAQKEFLDAGEGGRELKIYGRSAIPEVSELGGQGAATQARSLLRPQLKPASGGLPHGREAGRGLSASRAARPGRCVGRCGATMIVSIPPGNNVNIAVQLLADARPLMNSSRGRFGWVCFEL